MEVWGIPEGLIRNITENVSAHKYEGNVYIREMRPYGKGFRFLLGVRDYERKGYRRAQSMQRGHKTFRRMPYACWHAHRDIILGLLTCYPEARVKTALADYHGYHDFLNKYEATGYEAWHGFHGKKRYLCQMCDCDEWIETDVIYHDPEDKKRLREKENESRRKLWRELSQI